MFFVIEKNGHEEYYSSEKVHEIEERHVVLPEHWVEHIDHLKTWNDVLWSQNSCLISASEACDWQDSIETYAVLGVAIAVNSYSANYSDLYAEVKEILKNNEESAFPSKFFPDNEAEITNCPICLKKFSENLDEFRHSDRGKSWHAPWQKSKKQEGDDSSIQVMHINPLIEKKIRHNASNVRYGHRWCNVAMTDHSLEETLDFMSYIVKVHNWS